MSQDKLAEIKTHWEDSAHTLRDSDGLRPTARDPYLQEVVETAIERHLYIGAKLLDLGCGDGRSTLRFAQITGNALGVDFVGNFIKLARSNAESLAVNEVIFEQANVLDLEAVRQQFGMFDIITSIRCLINLAEWHYQSLAIQEISKMVRPGGLFIASEGWKEGFEGLNLYRQRVSLEKIAAAKYNCLISRQNFEDEVLKYFDIMEYINLGTYLFISRVVQPMYTRPEPPRHTHDLNRIAAEILNAGIGCNSFDFCDYSGIYILRRFKEK